MSHFGQKIQRMREAKGWTQAALGEVIGVTDQTISNWESLPAPRMRGHAYGRLAQAFGMTVDDLDREWRPQKIPQTKGDARGGIPVINRAPAGALVDYEEHGIDSGQAAYFLPRDGIDDPNAFCVIVVGESMTPHLLEGDRAIFSPLDRDGKTHHERLPAKDGDVVIVRVGPDSPTDGCAIGRLHRRKDGKIELRKDNPKFKSVIIDPVHVVRMSLLIESRRRFKAVGNDMYLATEP